MAEMAEGSYVVACRFPLPTLETIDEIGEGIDTVWVYKMDKNASHVLKA